ncbi:MAG: FAD-dependent oxidoreductase [Nitrososphaeria archaeon]|nr:FAD-dependent oxidoreductase [Nitrososphaeria archaeon]
MSTKKHVIIVGAGPAGIFTALELSKNSSIEVTIIDKGKDLDKRLKSSANGIYCGWGGAGAFSDGKLNFSTETGGWLSDYIEEKELSSIIERVDQIFLKYGAPEKVYGVDEDRILKIMREAAKADFRLIPSKLRHLGTDLCHKILQNIRADLEENVNIMMETEVKNVLIKNGYVKGVLTVNDKKIDADFVVLAPGRSGADWLKREADRLSLSSSINPVDLGVRVEVPAEVLEPLTSVLYEPKLVYYSKSFDDKVRTFCVNPYGYVVEEKINDLITVNGHSYQTKKSENTNFAVLVSTQFTEPFKDPIAYGKYIAKLANLLVNGVMIQRLGDLEIGRRSTEERISRSIITPTLKTARPGDLSFVLPGRYLTDIKEMLKALDKLAPGVYSNHTLLYGIEVKFYSSRLKLSNCLETEIKNLFTIGDGAGVSRGLVQAAASGLIVANEIQKRVG